MNHRLELKMGCLMLFGLLAAGPLMAQEFQPLFDGKSLAGWEKIGVKKDVWSVADGLLLMSGEGGGWLATPRDYSNFEFELEFQLTPDSNSGVYLRAPADTSHISRTGMEIQILDDAHPKYKNVQPWQRTGSIYHVAAAKTGFLKPTGEWNKMEIKADGPHVVIRLNGQVIVDDKIDTHPELEKEHTGLKRSTGRIGLQSHNGLVKFRNILVKELPGPK